MSTTQLQLTKDLCSRYNSLLEDIRLEIIRLTKGQRIEFDENGFEDDSSNDIVAVDGDFVYTSTGEDYNLHEVSFWDGIEIINVLETLTN